MPIFYWFNAVCILVICFYLAYYDVLREKYSAISIFKDIVIAQLSMLSAL